MPDFAARRDRLRRRLSKLDLPGMLVTSFTNVTYLTGFTGDDSYLLVSKDGECLLSDSRFSIQIEEECPGLEVAIRSTPVTMLQMATKVIRGHKFAQLGIEANSMTLATSAAFSRELSPLELVPTAGLVEDLRMIKDGEEIKSLRSAVRYAERAFGVLRATLRGDQTEQQIAAQIDFNLRQDGAKGSGFESIIAVGSRAALPHARPTTRRVDAGYVLLVDWGANEGLYISDLSRTLVTGKPTTKLEKVYKTVLAAQLAAIQAIRPGATCEYVDGVSRKIISDAGFGKNFGHGLGHGIGLQVHESPRFAANSSQPLVPGMVVTVEPGIYLADQFGVRIEDDVLVTKNGNEVLSSLPKCWETAQVE
jgi:Xaa-Pro aminopeptidase